MIKLNLQMFANPNTNATTSAATGNNISPEMRTFYDKNLIANATPNLIHDQFGQKKPIPKNGGKTIQFRKLNPFAKATTPLTEGVTPDGNKLDLTTIEATISQYGDYVTTSDLLNLTAVDNIILETQKIQGNQAGETLDWVVREVLNSGTNVQYHDGSVASRSALTADKKLTVDCIKKAVRTLKRNNAKKIDGYFVAIVHPDIVYDLTNDSEWKNVNQYHPDNWYKGEIGMIHGVRFVETSEAKIFEGAGASGADVYSTLVIGSDAYGVTEVEGGGLETILHQKGSGGTSDPLDQRSTIGWKATRTAEILTQAFMVRIETGATA